MKKTINSTEVRNMKVKLVEADQGVTIENLIKEYNSLKTALNTLMTSFQQIVKNVDVSLANLQKAGQQPAADTKAAPEPKPAAETPPAADQQNQQVPNK
jgi:hypothetical protein